MKYNRQPLGTQGGTIECTMLLNKLKAQLITAISTVLLLVSCAPKPLTSEEILNEYQSGVVLVANTHYYTISIDGEDVFYFSNYSESDGLSGFTSDEDSITYSVSWGTGFFVSEDGMIATNSHVVNPKVDDKTISKNMSKLFSAIKVQCQSEIDDYNVVIARLQNILSYEYDDDYYQMYQYAKQQRDEYQEIVENLSNISSSDIEIKTHCKISVGFSETHVTELADMESCVVIKDDPEHDLAIIQLKNKRTPEERCVFEVPSDEEVEYEIDEKLYAISYNMGPQLSITETGMRPQIQSGNISQITDNNQILYSIPTLPGSSGSPVIDSYGNLVAVNYAGISITQGFNYGIKVKHLYSLLNR